MRLGLYAQVVLSLSLGLVATVAPVGWWIARSQAALYADTMRANALVVARSQAENAAHFLVIEEYAGLEQQLRDAATLPEVRTLRLYAPSGRILVNVQRDTENTSPRVTYSSVPGKIPEGIAPLVEERDGQLVAWAPVAAGTLLGWLQITYSLEPVAAMGASIWRHTMLLGLAWIAVGVLIVTLVLRRPMRAIGGLSRFARELPQRKGERVPLPRSGNEIGLLADALDHASVELAETEHQQRQLEAQLRQAQKMEAIGLLAGGIAHDFNNILTGILGWASVLAEETAPGDPAREAAHEIEQAARRAAALTRGLLAFSRKQRMEPRPADLNEVVRGLDRMLRRVIGEEVELRTDLCDGALVANVDAAQIEQVLVNLATNAKDAMPSGGLLSVTTRVVSGEALHEASARPPIEGSVALVAVSDTGTGIDEERQQKIFEPFYTTKEVGKGTGLGLSIALGIVQQHGGAIRLYSRPGIGTTFKIYLPLSAEAATRVAATELPSARGGTERILLVEDEPPVRRVLRTILEKAGYAVTEAADGDEALALLERPPAPFQLVVSDVIMPRVNGAELRRAVRERLPNLPILFMSGYTQDVIRRRGLVDEDVELLTKPFTAREILARVREVLDRG